MSWLFLAVIGYFFNAAANVLDKYLLASRIPEPPVYAFLVSLFGLFAIVAAPFGFGFFGWSGTLLALASGMVFIYGLVALYRAVKKNEISRVAPLVGTFMALLALVGATGVGLWRSGSLTSIALVLSREDVLAFWLLLFGGFLIAFDLPLKRREILSGLKHSFWAGVFLLSSLVLLKNAYSDIGFVNGFVWSRLGTFVGGISLLLVPSFREVIFESFNFGSTPKRRNLVTGLFFLVNKVFGALGMFSVNYALFLGPLVMVQALMGVQFAFVALLAIPFSLWKPKLFGEKLTFADWTQKGVALMLIALGIGFASLGGVNMVLF